MKHTCFPMFVLISVGRNGDLQTMVNPISVFNAVYGCTVGFSLGVFLTSGFQNFLVSVMGLAYNVVDMDTASDVRFTLND